MMFAARRFLERDSRKCVSSAAVLRAPQCASIYRPSTS